MAQHSETKNSGYLEGQLLVATPNVSGSSFKKAVIFVCAHSQEGAMGIIVNHTLDNITYHDLFEQLDITHSSGLNFKQVHYGGPVEINRGFVIYEDNGRFTHDAMLTVNGISISGSVSILRSIAEGDGPERCMLALGYAGWAPGQLEEEIQSNSWISVPVSQHLVFDGNNSTKWERAGMLQGVDLSKLSSTAGHA